MLVHHWNLHLLFSNRENQVYSERSCLDAWRYSIRFPQLANQTAGFPIIRRISYKQTFIKTGRKGRFIENAPPFLRTPIDLIFIFESLYDLWNKHKLFYLFPNIVEAPALVQPHLIKFPDH